MATKKKTKAKKSTDIAGLTVSADKLEAVARAAARRAVRHAPSAMSPNTRALVIQAAQHAAALAARGVADLLIPDAVDVTAAPAAKVTADVDWLAGTDEG